MNTSLQTIVTLPLFRKKTIDIAIDRIIYVESSSSICYIKIRENKKTESIPINCTLNRIEDLLHFEHFYKIHRSIIINMNYVSHYESYPGRTLQVKETMEILPLSKRRKLDFHNAFKAYKLDKK